MKGRIPALLFLWLLFSVCTAYSGWFPQNSGTTSLLMDGFFTDPQTGWVVGITNTILYTSDGGDNWTPQSPPPSVNYYSVYFTDSVTGCAVGATVGGSGRIRRTVDGGTTWDIITPPGDAYSLWGVYFFDSNNGWIAGGREPGFNIDPITTIHYTSNGGVSWNLQLYQYDSLALHDVHFSSAVNGCAVGEHGRIFWTTDGGTNWIQRPSPTFKNLWGVFLKDDSTAWAVGVQGTVLHTTDSGNNWASVDVDSTCGFGKVIFTDADNGWIVGNSPDSGVVLHTTDGGDSWDYQHTGTTHGLMSIYFTDSDTGWAVGNIGTILHTTDGGVTGIEENGDMRGTTRPLRITCTPNPFRTKVEISLLGEQGNRSSGEPVIQVYDVMGRRVREISILSSQFPILNYVWDGYDKDGSVVSPGIYFISTGNSEKQKIVKIH